MAGTCHCVTPNPYKPPAGGLPERGSGVAQLRFKTSSLTLRITKIELDGSVVCGGTGAPSCNPSANVHDMEFLTAATLGEHRLALVVEKGRRWQSGAWKSFRLPVQPISLVEEGSYLCDVLEPQSSEAHVACTLTDKSTRRAPAPLPATAPASSGCAKDTDCKGERICRDGRCSEPKASAACGRDTHCKGDRVCSEGRCADPGPTKTPEGVGNRLQ